MLLPADSVRPLDTNTLELKLGETPQPEGDALIAAGVHSAEVELVITAPELARVRPEAPEPVRRMVACSRRSSPSTRRSGGSACGDLAAGLADWADQLRASYLPTFLNPDTGWIAGWRSADGALHDHAFPLVNGSACRTDLVDAARGGAIMGALWAEFARVGYDDFRNGLPLNLRRIPEDDIRGVSFGLPRGCSMQGGASHHRARLFVDALYPGGVGMEHEGDLVVRAWPPPSPTTEPFGGLATALDRWRA